MKKKPKRAFKPSPGYSELLAYINTTPSLISMLYDLNLLPETVSDIDKISTRQAMLAVVLAHRHMNSALLTAAPPLAGVTP